MDEKDQTASDERSSSPPQPGAGDAGDGGIATLGAGEAANTQPQTVATPPEPGAATATSGTSSRSEQLDDEIALPIPALTPEEQDHQLLVALDMNDEEFAKFMKSRAKKADRHVEQMETHAHAAQACFAEDAPFILEMRERLDNSGHRTDLLTEGQKERTKEYKKRTFGAETFDEWVAINYHYSRRWMNRKLSAWKQEQEDVRRYFNRPAQKILGDGAPIIEGCTGSGAAPPAPREKSQRSKPDAQDIRRWKQIANAAVQNLDADPDSLRAAIRQARDSMPLPLMPIEKDSESEKLALPPPPKDTPLPQTATYADWKNHRLPAATFKRKYFAEASDSFLGRFHYAVQGTAFKKVLDMLENKPQLVPSNADDFANLAVVLRRAADNLNLLAAVITTALTPPPETEPQPAPTRVEPSGQQPTPKDDSHLTAWPNGEPESRESNPGSAASSKLELAEAWLRRYLRNGPMPIPDSFIKQGLCRYNYAPDQLPPYGIGKKTIDQAIIKLGVERLPTGPKGGIRWHLPEKKDQPGAKAAASVSAEQPSQGAPEKRTETVRAKLQETNGSVTTEQPSAKTLDMAIIEEWSKTHWGSAKEVRAQCVGLSNRKLKYIEQLLEEMVVAGRLTVTEIPRERRMGQYTLLGPKYRVGL